MSNTLHYDRGKLMLGDVELRPDDPIEVQVAGVNIEQVASFLGHTSLETTRMYITPTEQDLVKAVEKLES